MEKVDQDYLDAIISSKTNIELAENDKTLIKDPMEVYESIQKDAINLGNGDLSLDNEIIMKFLQVR